MKFLALILIVLTCSACVKTKLTSYTDPSARAGYKIARIIVSAPDMPLAERQQVETKFAEQFNTQGIFVLRGIDAFPPTRQLTTEQIAQVVVDSRVDSILTITGYLKSTDSTYVPPTYHAGTTTSTVNFYGNYAYVTSNTTPGYTTGGYSIKKPVYSYTLHLWEASSGRVIWTAEADARGSVNADAETFGHSTAATTITKLKDDGIIR